MKFVSPQQFSLSSKTPQSQPLLFVFFLFFPTHSRLYILLKHAIISIPPFVFFCIRVIVEFCLLLCPLYGCYTRHSQSIDCVLIVLERPSILYGAFSTHYDRIILSL